MNPQMQMPKIDPVEQARQEKMIKDAPFVVCPECGGRTFSEKLMFKKISGLMTGTGQDQVVNIPALVCDGCGKVPKMFDPKGIMPEDMIAKEEK